MYVAQPRHSPLSFPSFASDALQMTLVHSDKGAPGRCRRYKFRLRLAVQTSSPGLENTFRAWCLPAYLTYKQLSPQDTKPTLLTMPCLGFAVMQGCMRQILQPFDSEEHPPPPPISNKEARALESLYSPRPPGNQGTKKYENCIDHMFPLFPFLRMSKKNDNETQISVFRMRGLDRVVKPPPRPPPGGRA